MTQNTIITFEAAGKTLVFSVASPFWVQDIKGISSISSNISETQSANQIGSTRTGKTIKPRDVTITAVVTECVEQNREYVLSCIVPDKSCKLTYSQNGQSWYLEGDVTDTPEFSDGSITQTFQFTIHCPYPYWRNSITALTQLASLISHFRFPRKIEGTWKISEFKNNVDTIVRLAGSQATEFTLTMTAVSKVVNPKLYQVETGSFIYLEKTMETGEVAVISTVYGQKGITYINADGISENGFRYLNVDSDLDMKLLPGTNTLRVTAEDNREGLRCSITAPSGVKAGV